MATKDARLAALLKSRRERLNPSPTRKAQVEAGQRANLARPERPRKEAK